MKQIDESAYKMAQSTTSLGSSLYREELWVEHERSSREIIHACRACLAPNLQSPSCLLYSDAQSRVQSDFGARL